MDEDVPAADFAEEDPLGTVVEERDETQGERAVQGENQAKGEMRQAGVATEVGG